MKALTVLVFGVFAIAANLAGRGGAGPPAVAAGAPAPSHADDCRGGAGDAVTVKLEPARIDGGRMAIDVHVHQHLEDAASIIGAVEVIDDRGRRIGDTGALALRKLAAGSAESYRIERHRAG